MDYPTLVAWCEEFRADFGHLELTPLAAATPTPAPEAGASPMPSTALRTCTSNTPYVGLEGPLTTMDHGVRGAGWWLWRACVRAHRCAVRGD